MDYDKTLGLNHHIPAYPDRDIARITMADWVYEKAECLNPIDGIGQQKDFGRQRKQIPASWITAQRTIRDVTEADRPV